MIEERYRVVAEKSVALVKGIERTGLKVLSLRERYAKTMMPLEGNVNHVGMMYAGSLFTLGEFSGGIIHGVTFDYTRLFPIVKQVSIEFKRPALTDVTLEITMSKEKADRIRDEAEEKGRADFSLDLEIRDANNDTVSLVNGTWQVRRIPEGMRDWFEKS